MHFDLNILEFWYVLKVVLRFQTDIIIDSLINTLYYYHYYSDLSDFNIKEIYFKFRSTVVQKIKFQRSILHP